ncbi:MAG TPA: HAMP domain-containing sensor histidine kinase [Nitrososphaeraceae archaeon]|nr:HAMP domain-containing sensor histidine kinase [Nitrososphaeraceae archaeon]
MNPRSNPGKLDQDVWIVNGPEKILNFYISRTKFLEKSVVCCYDYNGPIRIRKTAPIWKANLEVDKRGIMIRFLTDIRTENLEYCKSMLEEIKHIEMRHMDGAKGNFTIHDGKEYFLPFFVDKPGEPVSNLLLFCIQKEMVEAHLFIFENLWRQATPAHLRIKELEEGIHPEVLETLRETEEIIGTGYRLVSSARNEILLIYHSANALIRQENSGGLDILVESTIQYNIQVKILVPVEDKIIEIIQRLERINGIQIRNIEPSMQTRMTILIVDRMYSLIVELKDDIMEDTGHAIGLATYSNSKSTVLSYVSIFETLWKQSELREELEIRSLAQKEFINIAAHELRNPIQPILGLSDILLQSGTFLDKRNINQDKQKELIEIIARNARRLQRLTEDILDVTRIEGRTLKLNKQKFLLVKIIREMLGDYNTNIMNSNKNIIIAFSNSKELESTYVFADQNRIKQVMSNLIDNAIKFTSEGTITVTAEIEHGRGHITIKVKDSGRGIDPEMLPKLFTKFATKSEKGTGLGLYISKGIIEAHGGSIRAENNAAVYGAGGGDGATFSFSLPLVYA